MPFRARRVIWSLRGRDWSVRGRGSQGEGGIEAPLPLSGLLVTFAPWQKSLAAAAAKHPPEIKYTAPQGHQCTGRAGARQAPLPPKFSSPVTFWTQYYGYVTLAPNPLTSVGGSAKITVRQWELYRANCPQMFPFTPFSGHFGPISAQIVDAWFLRDSGARSGLLETWRAKSTGFPLGETKF